MKRPVLLSLASVLVLGIFVTVSGAQNFPAIKHSPNQFQSRHPSKIKPKRFYGYVPPAPIRHVWPGGYRVIFHDLFNMMSDHQAGRY